MALSNFQKFLEEKKAAGKNGGDPAPKVNMSVVPDYTGKHHDKPPGGGNSYGTGKGVGKEFSEAPKGEPKGKSLADHGDKSLKYSPATPYKSTVSLKPVKNDKKSLKSENFVDLTKDMSPTQFAEFMSKKNSNLGEVHSVVGTFSSLVKTNPSGVEALVSEARRNGFFKRLMSEMLQYPESMQVIAKVLGDENNGMAAARRLVNAMNEMVGPPMHKTLGAGPKKALPAPGDAGPPDPNAMGGPDDEDMPEDPDALGDDPTADDPDALGDDDMDDDDVDAGLEDEDGEDDDDMGDDDMGDDELDPDADPNADPNADPAAGDDDLLGAPDPNAKKPPFQVKMPRPSMMNRMMRPESNSLAVQNFMRALQG